MKALLWAVALAAGWSSAASGADKPIYAPAPAWVKPISLPKPRGDVPTATQLLLWNTQSRYGPDGDETYSEVATRIESSEGLAGAGNLIQTWSPDSETLTIHRLHVIRDGAVIDLLAGGKTPIVMRRETNLESAALDGELTATVQAEDLRVGDVINVAVTVRRRDPALAGRSEAGVLIDPGGSPRRVYVRQLWPESEPIRWKASPDLGAPAVNRTGGTELVYDFADRIAPDAPNGAPDRFGDLGLLQVSEFTDWAELAGVLAPLYVKASQLRADSGLRAEAEKIRRAHATPEARAMAALRLVQDQVRYVYVGMDFGNYSPADADLTWTRRFGDCKGKTALLLALLRELGIEAEPALVSTEGGDGLEARLPMMSWFDHVLVRATVGGRTYWMDGTRLGDRRLEDLPVPDHRWALPVRAAGAQLVSLEPPALAEAEEERRLEIDLTGGYGKPAIVRAEQVYRGDGAVSFNLFMSRMSKADADKAMRAFWREDYAWLTPETVKVAFDETTRVARLTVEGRAALPWSEDRRSRDLIIDDSDLGWDDSYAREPGPHQDAPFAVNHPLFESARVVIRLPEGGANAVLVNRTEVDEQLAGYAFKRTAKLENGVVTVDASTRSLAREFPAAAAAAAEVKLRQLAQHPVMLRVVAAGPEVAAEAPAAAKGAAPTDAAGFARRGAARVLRGELKEAIADLTRAVELDPKSPRYLYDRGVARLRDDQEAAALADFEAALRLKPDDALSLMARGQLRLFRGQVAPAAADFDAALKATGDRLTLLERIADAYEEEGRYEPAVRHLDLLVAETSDPKAKAAALNDRCWAKAKWGRDLGSALADCDASLQLAPNVAAALDSRGFVRLRQGHWAEAAADYDKALAHSSTHASALYGRGLARRKLGAQTDAARDLARAVELEPEVAETYAAVGLKP